MTLSDVDELGQVADALDVTFQMDEDAFRSFYDRTARPVWAYLSRTTGDNRLADDLLQETYYRFLRAGGSYSDEAHRRHYLFRIAVNLVRDHYRRNRQALRAMPPNPRRLSRPRSPTPISDSEHFDTAPSSPEAPTPPRAVVPSAAVPSTEKCNVPTSTPRRSLRIASKCNKNFS